MSSTTSDVSVLENPLFLGKSGDRTLFQINTSQAVDIAIFSKFGCEAELLLPPMALRITGLLNSGNGLTVITCEDDAKSPQLLGVP